MQFCVDAGANSLLFLLSTLVRLFLNRCKGNFEHTNQGITHSTSAAIALTEEPSEEETYKPSAYEKLRVEKIKRNEAIMESLGLCVELKEAAPSLNVEEIKDHREASKKMGGWELLVRVRGSNDDTWESIKNLKKRARVKVKKYVAAHQDVFNVPVLPVRRQPTRTKIQENVSSKSLAAATSSAVGKSRQQAESDASSTDDEMVEQGINKTASAIATSSAAQDSKPHAEEGNVTDMSAVEAGSKEDETETAEQGITETASAVATSSLAQEFRKHAEEGDATDQKTVEANSVDEETETVEQAAQKEVEISSMDEATETLEQVGVVASSTPPTLGTEQKQQHHKDGDAFVQEAEIGRIEEANNFAETKEPLPLPTMGFVSPHCQHDNYSMTHYKEETNPKYCKAGSKFYLADVMCAVCHDMFTSTEKSKRGEYFKPSISKPLYACIQSVVGCQHAICYFCFQKKLLSS